MIGLPSGGIWIVPKPTASEIISSGLRSARLVPSIRYPMRSDCGVMRYAVLQNRVCACLLNASHCCPAITRNGCGEPIAVGGITDQPGAANGVSLVLNNLSSCG